MWQIVAKHVQKQQQKRRIPTASSCRPSSGGGKSPGTAPRAGQQNFGRTATTTRNEADPSTIRRQHMIGKSKNNAEIHRRGLSSKASTFKVHSSVVSAAATGPSLSPTLLLSSPPSTLNDHYASFDERLSSSPSSSSLENSKNNTQALQVLLETLLHSQRLVRKNSSETENGASSNDHDYRSNGASFASTPLVKIPFEKAAATRSDDDDDDDEVTQMLLMPEASNNSVLSSSNSASGTERIDKKLTMSARASGTIDEKSTLSTGAAETLTVPHTEGIRESKEESPESARKSLIERVSANFCTAMKKKKRQHAFRQFQFAVSKDIVTELDPSLVVSLFHWLAGRRRPIEAREVMTQCVAILSADMPKQKKKLHSINIRMCDLVRYLDPNEAKPWRCEELARSLMIEVNAIPDNEQRHNCLRMLLSALVEQRLVSLGKLANVVYNKLEEEKAMSPMYLEHLLSMSKYYRQTDLPYAKILVTCAFEGQRPNPTSVAIVIENLFPFTNIDEIKMVLQAVVHLQSSQVRDGKQYDLDILTLETVSATAARTGSVDVIELIWDYLVESDKEPSVGIYESTAVAFSCHPDKLQNVFAVLNEMQSRGWTPSRALVRSISSRIRHSVVLIEAALNLVLDEIEEWHGLQRTNPENEQNSNKSTVPFPLPALNVALSAAGEEGEVDLALKIMKIVQDNDLPADSDTFSYALESLGKHVGKGRRSRDVTELNSYAIGKAVDFLAMMEAREINPTHHVIRSYVELLCRAGDVETATAVVSDSLASDKDAVDNKTLYKVSMANAERGQFDLARKIAGMGSEPMPFLLQRIQQIEEEELSVNFRQR